MNTIAIDAGHGMGNTRSGRYDPGAVAKANGQTWCEADIALKYALTLKWLLVQKGVGFFLTRTSSAEPCNLRFRVGRAKKANCTHFVSLHLNSNSGPRPGRGVEVFHNGKADSKAFAEKLQRVLVGVTGFADRGAKPHPRRLAVLRFPGPVALIELGFLNNPLERQYLMERQNRIRICTVIAQALSP